MVESAKISIHYIAKLEYTGSDQGMRYMMKKVTKDEKDAEGNEVKVSYLRTFAWPEPFAFAKTDPEKIISQDFPFDAQGKEQAVNWLNDLHQKEYEKAQN